MSAKLFIQCSFAPNVYDLAAIFRADQVLILGGQPWSRKGRSHRAAIRNKDQRQWIGLPIRTEDKKTLISQARIDSKQDWTGPFLNAVQHGYSKARYHDYYWKEFEALIMEASKHERLWDFNTHILRGLLEFTSLQYVSEKLRFIPDPYDFRKDPEVLFGNDIPKVFATEDPKQSSVHSTYTCIQECHSHTYMSPIPEAETSYVPGFHYPQHHGAFMEHCSFIDLLFEQGPESYRYLKNQTY